MSSHSRAAYGIWSQFLDLPSEESLRLRSFAAQERAYFNALVEGFSGPIRTMAETIGHVHDRYAGLFGFVAETGCDVRTLRREQAPDFASLFDERGRLSLSPRHALIFDIAAAPAVLHTKVRRAMALAMLAFAKEQADALASPLPDHGYRFAITMLSSHEERTKRHLQMPRTLLKIRDEEGRTTITLPYFSISVEIATPRIPWNYATLRWNGDPERPTAWVLELSQENEPYILRRADSARRPKKRKPDQANLSK